MSQGVDSNMLERAPGVLSAIPDNDIVHDVDLPGHMASLSLNQDNLQQYQSPQFQEMQNIQSQQQLNSQNQRNMYNIKNSNKNKNKNKNNSDLKPIQAEKPIEFCAVEKLQENEELYDTTRFAKEMVKWGTGANDPESLSEWFKDQINQLKEIKLKEESNSLVPADYPKLIQTNCLLQWSIGNIENIW